MPSTLASAAPALSVPDVILESFRGRFWDNFFSWPNSDSELVPDNSMSASSTEPSPARSSADISTYLPTKGSHIVAFGFFTPIGNVIRYIITLISVLLLNFSDLSGSIWVYHRLLKLLRYVIYGSTVHDTENLTFSKEFRGCSARNDADFPHGCRRTSVRADMDLLCGRARIFCADGHESSVRIRFENGRNQKANFVCNNAKGSRNTPQGSFEISL